MQNVKIDLYISKLLYSYDCVIVPEFGGFVANYASAKLHPIHHKLTPPSKQISFNSNLKTNDGLLTSHIAQRKAISYDEAKDLIQAFVDQSLSGLKQGDKISIEKVGTLFLDPEGNIQFVATESNDFLLDSYGLGTLRAKAIVREGAEERIERKIKEHIPILKEEEKKKRKFYWPAAAVLFFLLASSLFLNQQFNWVEGSQVQFSNLGFESSEASAYVHRSSDLDANIESWNNFKAEVEREESIVPYVANGEAKTGLWVDNRSDDRILEEDNTAVKVEGYQTGLKFHVMGGCFSNYSNAEGLVKTLHQKGFESRLLGEYKNLHAVSYASFASRSEALALLAEVKATENKDAWLLVRPF